MDKKVEDGLEGRGKAGNFTLIELLVVIAICMCVARPMAIHAPLL